MTFGDFFRQAMGDGAAEPYPFQERFAVGERLPELVCIPTGAGKTATAILGWLWRRRHISGTPRRLVYCLPMRVLVEQTFRQAKTWVRNLGLDIPVYLLLGGSEIEPWFLYPEREAILIGTQDMLLSRALNRGYAASRFHWPVDFAWLNNDCLWILDEPHLMGTGVTTSAQLAGLRQALGTFGECPSVWMSATLEKKWLDTYDFRSQMGQLQELRLEQADHQMPALRKRLTAEKKLQAAPLAITKEADRDEIRKLAELVSSKHVPGTQTLVIVNTVRRAQALFQALAGMKNVPPNRLLLHSRFRPPERRHLQEQLQAAGRDRILVATQVVEAGVDLSARTLLTELAPWSSLVQRFGRCNRTGEDGPGQVYWIAVAEDRAAPYTPEELEFAREQLRKLEEGDISPLALEEFQRAQQIVLSLPSGQVLRRRDLLELFDTAADLSGNDVDISRFVRGDDPDIDVQVFWRDLGDQEPAPEEPAPQPEELCSVPAGEVREFLKNRVGYVWDHLEERWRKIRREEVRPGLVILLPAKAGGYDWDTQTGSGRGWDVKAEAPVPSIPVPDAEREPEEATGSDPDSIGQTRPWTIAQHTEHVCRELQEILHALGPLLDTGPQAGDWRQHLLQAACWHDVGKAHAVFQKSLRRANPGLSRHEYWAKSGSSCSLRHDRRHFRHELASALAALQNGLPFPTAYLIAAHHGRVRLSLRALPGEETPEDPDRLYALGIWDGDELPAVSLGNGAVCPATRLDLTPMLLGAAQSWTERAVQLRDQLGPFRLAYLEALLRSADGRASRREKTENGYA